jgi:hypothetical protein
VMAGSEALRAAALAGILLLIWLGQMTLPLLSLLGFIAVCGTVAYSVAARFGAVAGDVATTARSQCADRTGAHDRVRQRSGARRRAGRMGGAAPAFGFAAALSVIAVVLLSGIYEPARRLPRAAIRCRISRKAPRSCCIIRCCGRCSSPSSSSTPLVPAAAVFVPYAVPISACPPPASARRLAMYGVGMVVGALWQRG